MDGRVLAKDPVPLRAPGPLRIPEAKKEAAERCKKHNWTKSQQQDQQMTDESPSHRVKTMIPSVPHHERLFEEICSKLNELSRTRSEEDFMPNQEKIDRLQTQIRRFQTDLEDTQQEMREKMKVLENVQVGHNSDLHNQLKQVTEQLNAERGANNKLNTDLAKSLELGLQLQLEIQNLKARTHQVQTEERKFSQTLQDKVRQVSHDLELSRALREELETELGKARARFMSEQETWAKDKAALEALIQSAKTEKSEILQANEGLVSDLKAKDADIANLSEELEKMSVGLTDIEDCARKQQEAMKNLTEVAGNKIVELKMALDRKTAECKDYEGHLNQALTQTQLMKQENLNLKDYIAKMNVFLQSSPNPAASPATSTASNGSSLPMAAPLV
jgi:chromosome segregation ATPase